VEECDYSEGDQQYLAVFGYLRAALQHQETRRMSHRICVSQTLTREKSRDTTVFNTDNPTRPTSRVLTSRQLKKRHSE